MEVSTKDISTYRTLLVSKIKDAFVTNAPVAAIDHELIISKYKALLEHINGFIVICNYTNGFYEYVSPGFHSHLGHKIDGLSHEHLTNFLLTLIHEKDREFMLNIFLPNVFNYFKENSHRINVIDYRYTCCLRVKDVNDKFLWYLIDTTIIETDQSGTPVRTLITCTDINSFKKDEILYYNILKKNPEGIYEVMLEGGDNNKKDPVNLTSREVEVLNLISTGATTKEIAQKLFLTDNTIKTHRKNILRKTKCRGIAELTNFAFSRGLI